MPGTALLAAIGSYAHTERLISGAVGSRHLHLEFAAVSPISRGFAPMVREGRYDVSEMAIATFLQARACGKPLVLLPVTLAARFQEAALLCRADSSLDGPADIAGRRVGVRAYSQTTGMWLRGTLSEAYDVTPDQVDWITFEHAHVAEYHDPPWATRAAPGQEMLAMLKAGELDAAIFGNELPGAAGLRTVFPNPMAAGEAFRRLHGFMPVNHLVTVRRKLADDRPGLLPELLRVFRDAQAGAPDLPIGRAALQPAIALALRYSAEQELLPQPLAMADVWAGLPEEGTL